MEEVLRRTSLVPLAFPCFILCLIGMETEGLLDYQGLAGIISIARWNLRPVIFGVEFFGEPVVCSPDSCGFRHFRGFRDCRQSNTKLLVCSCLSCPRRSRDFRRFVKGDPGCKI